MSIFDKRVTYKPFEYPGIYQFTDAINNAFKEASKTVKNIQWGEMGRVTFRLDDAQKIEYQAEVRIGFKIERGDD